MPQFIDQQSLLKPIMLELDLSKKATGDEWDEYELAYARQVGGIVTDLAGRVGLISRQLGVNPAGADDNLEERIASFSSYAAQDFWTNGNFFQFSGGSKNILQAQLVTIPYDFELYSFDIYVNTNHSDDTLEVGIYDAETEELMTSGTLTGSATGKQLIGCSSVDIIGGCDYWLAHVTTSITGGLASTYAMTHPVSVLTPDFKGASAGRTFLPSTLPSLGAWYLPYLQFYLL